MMEEGNQEYVLHNETAQMVVEGLTILLAHERGETLPEPTEEWVKNIEAAKGTLEAQNPDLSA